MGNVLPPLSQTRSGPANKGRWNTSVGFGSGTFDPRSFDILPIGKMHLCLRLRLLCRLRWMISLWTTSLTVFANYLVPNANFSTDTSKWPLISKSGMLLCEDPPSSCIGWGTEWESGNTRMDPQHWISGIIPLLGSCRRPVWYELLDTKWTRRLCFRSYSVGCAVSVLGYSSPVLFQMVYG